MNHCRHYRSFACAIKVYAGRLSPALCLTACERIEPPPVQVTVDNGIVRSRDRRSGAERWAWLHERAGKPIDDPAEELRLIRALADGLAGCACKRDWSIDTDANPPPLHAPALMPRWGYDRHQHVNERRGVAGITYAEACAVYGWPD